MVFNCFCWERVERENKIYDVLYDGEPVRDAVNKLLSSPPARELMLPENKGEYAKRLMNKLGIETDT